MERFKLSAYFLWVFNFTREISCSVPAGIWKANVEIRLDSNWFELNTKFWNSKYLNWKSLSLKPIISFLLTKLYAEIRGIEIEEPKIEDYVDRKVIRFMGPGSAYNYIAMKEAVKDSVSKIVYQSLMDNAMLF